MNHQSFSKIWILIIILALAGGGIFAWQYLVAPEGEETADWRIAFEECERAIDPTDQFYCFWGLLRDGKVRDEIFCQEFPTPELKARCYWQVARIKADITLCEKIDKKFGWMIHTCKAEFAEITKTYGEEEAKKIIENRATETTLAIKNKDMKELSSIVHPDKGVRFSPYAFVDVEKDLIFSRTQILNFFKDQTVYNWGVYDGIGTPINLTPEAYYNKFIYDVDFINAEEISYNRIIGRGLTINNAFYVYPNAIIVEYHFSGFDPKHKGMDWRSLRLIFEEKDNVWYLVGIIHDQWTI